MQAKAWFQLHSATSTATCYRGFLVVSADGYWKGQHQALLEGSTQDTLSLMFAAVMPGRVENVDGPTRGVTIARGCLCSGVALLLADCAERSVL